MGVRHRVARPRVDSCTVLEAVLGLRLKDINAPVEQLRRRAYCRIRSTQNGERSAQGRTMDKWAFGFTMMVIGIGGTFLTLTILIWSIYLLKWIFPLSAEGKNKAQQP